MAQAGCRLFFYLIRKKKFAQNTNSSSFSSHVTAQTLKFWLKFGIKILSQTPTTLDFPTFFPKSNLLPWHFTLILLYYHKSYFQYSLSTHFHSPTTQNTPHTLHHTSHPEIDTDTNPQNNHPSYLRYNLPLYH